ncbi:transient receptor potential cation channel subfamily A member 1 homolog isoform X3 [Macrobrachium rosenbergii]|uniref:transient receptor potential cation channel subfamily A member 1 homolog isoform X3 n=1 Tax=Macrobrachium rosenbergii TaxID=79674 RepID=UPI0034D470C9
MCDGLPSTYVTWRPASASAKKLRDLCSTTNNQESERIQEVQFLLSDYPDIINMTSADGQTPLHIAAINNQAWIIPTLLRNDADLEFYDDAGFTPLLHTITRQSLECFEILLESGVDVNNSSANGQPPLHWAVKHYYKHGRMVEKLLKCGADVNMVDDDNQQTPLHVAAYVGNTVVLQELLNAKPRDINALDISTLSPLHLAAEKGNRDCCEILLASGANCSVRNKHKETPLMLAVKNCFTKTCEILLQSNRGSVNDVNNSHQTPVIIAARSNKAASVFVLQALLKCEPDLKATTLDGDTALHYAAKNGSAQKCRDLMEAGADCNITNKHKTTPIHCAAKKNAISCVATLLGFSEEEICDLLFSDSGSEDARLRFCPSNCSSQGVVDSCPGDYDTHDSQDVNVKDNQGMTPLHYALMKSSEECCKLLLKKRANVHLKNNKSNTPLHLAAERGLAKCCILLLSKGADVNATNDEEKTSLHLAAAAGSRACCKILMKKGAELSVVDKMKMSPLHYAAKVGSAECCELLLKKVEKNFASYSADTPLHLAAKEGYLNCCEQLVQNTWTVKYLLRRNEDGQMPHNAAFDNGKDDAFCFLLHKALEYIVREKSSEKFGRSQRKDRKEDEPILKPALSDLLRQSIQQKRGNAVDAIVKCPKWLDALSSERERSCTSNLCHLIKHFPEVAKVVLDGCIETSLEGRKIYRFIFLENIYFYSEANDATDSGILGLRKIFIMKRVSSYLRRNLLPNTTIGGRILQTAVGMYKRFFQAVGVVLKFVFHPNDLKEREMTTEDEQTISGIPEWSPFFSNGSLKPSALERPESETSGQEHPLICMVKNRRLDLLGHEVCQRLLKYKWDRYVKRISYGLFIFSALFVVILSIYATLAYDWVYVQRVHNLTRESVCGHRCANRGGESASCPSIASGPNANRGYCFSSKPDLIAEAEPHQSSFRILALVLLVINVTIELFRIHRLYVSYRQLKRMAPLLISYVCSGVLLVNWTECNDITEIREEWQWVCGVLSVMLGWFNVVMLLGWIPAFGLYLIILNDFMMTMLKLAFFFFLQVVAFSVAFQMLLRDHFVFSNYARSTMKILTMIMGDLSYDDHFSNKEKPLHYPLLSHLLLICFLGIIGVITLNLISNFSNEELDKAKKQTKLITLSRQVTMILEMESMFPLLRRHYARGWVEDSL